MFVGKVHNVILVFIKYAMNIFCDLFQKKKAVLTLL